MNLSPAQKSTLKAWVIANNNSLFDQSSVDLLNALVSPDYWVWDTAAVVENIFGAITWKNFTAADPAPVAAIPSAPTEAEKYALQLWIGRVLLCQSKQINIQTIVLGRTNLDATKTSTRTGIKDALQGLPAGVAGVVLDAGWTAVRNAMERRATLVEKLLVVSGTGTQADASTMGLEGLVTLDDVVESEGA